MGGAERARLDRIAADLNARALGSDRAAHPAWYPKLSDEARAKAELLGADLAKRAAEVAEGRAQWRHGEPVTVFSGSGHLYRTYYRPGVVFDAKAALAASERR